MKRFSEMFMEFLFENQGDVIPTISEGLRMLVQYMEKQEEGDRYKLETHGFENADDPVEIAIKMKGAHFL